MEDLRFTERTVKDALDRLNYILVLVKDDPEYTDLRGKLPELRVHLSETSMTVSKSFVRSYIRESFQRMEDTANRVDEIEYLESYQPAFEFHVMRSFIFVTADPEEVRTAENLALHAKAKALTDKVWGKGETS